MPVLRGRPSAVMGLAFSYLRRFLYRCLHIEESKGRTPERTREEKEEILQDEEQIRECKGNGRM